jgi:hypothetical protein
MSVRVSSRTDSQAKGRVDPTSSSFSSSSSSSIPTAPDHPPRRQVAFRDEDEDEENEEEFVRTVFLFFDRTLSRPPSHFFHA